jgi:hypothetical protein
MRFIFSIYASVQRSFVIGTRIIKARASSRHAHHQGTRHQGTRIIKPRASSSRAQHDPALAEYYAGGVLFACCCGIICERPD